MDLWLQFFIFLKLDLCLKRIIRRFDLNKQKFKNIYNLYAINCFICPSFVILFSKVIVYYCSE